MEPHELTQDGISSLFFEDLKIGEKHVSSGRTVTEADIVQFAEISGDYNPLHTDEEYTKKTLFKGRIAHGALTFSIMTGLWDRLGILRETVVAFYGVDKMRFVAPVYVGDTLHVKLEIAEKQDRGKDGIVTFLNEVFNQESEVVMACRATMLMKKRKVINP